MCKNKIIIKNKRYQPLKKDVITRQITAEAAKENAKTLGERLIKEMEVNIVTGKQIGRAHV